MDLAHFGLSRRPFRAAPTPELYVPTNDHEAALVRLRGAFDAGEGIALLDGAPGTGKTLIAVQFLASLGPDSVPIFLPAARFARSGELHQSILSDLGLSYQGLSENELRLAVTGHWLGELAAGRRGAVVLDEAQHLGSDLLEEIRLLDNLDGRGTKAVFTLLVGLGELRDQLARPELSSLAQRISCRVRLGPLSQNEAVLFLRRQLEECGGAGEDLMPADAAELLASYAAGNPRALNQLAAAAFGIAKEGGEHVVDVEAIGEAADRLGMLPIQATDPVDVAWPAESKPGEDGEVGEGAERGQSRGPKLKARKRRAA